VPVARNLAFLNQGKQWSYFKADLFQYSWWQLSGPVDLLPSRFASSLRTPGAVITEFSILGNSIWQLGTVSVFSTVKTDEK